MLQALLLLLILVTYNEESSHTKSDDMVRLHVHASMKVATQQCKKIRCNAIEYRDVGFSVSFPLIGCVARIADSVVGLGFGWGLPMKCEREFGGKIPSEPLGTWTAKSTHSKCYCGISICKTQWHEASEIITFSCAFPINPSYVPIHRTYNEITPFL